MKHNGSRLLPICDRLTPFIAPVIYLIVTVLVIGRLDISLYLKIASAISLSTFGILTVPGFGDHLSNRTRMAMLVVGLCGIAAVLCYRLNNLWIDHHGFNGAVWSIFARTIDRHGFLNTHGYCYWTGGNQFVPSATIYDHHPPGLVWIMALAFRLCGVHEATARAIPVMFSLLGVVSLTTLLTRRMGVSAGVSILPVLLASPGFAYYGRMVNFEPIVIGLSLTFYSWLVLQPAARWVTFGLLLIVLMTPLMGWVGTPLAIGAAFALARRRFGWGYVSSLAFVLLPLAVCAFCLLYNSDWGQRLPDAVNRAGAWSNYLHRGMATYSVSEWLRHVVGNATLLMPWPLWILVALLPLGGIKRSDTTLLLGTLVPFLMMIPLMSHAVYIHDYHMLFWWPAAAVSFASLTAKHRTPVVALAASLLLLCPVAMGLRTTQEMHGKGNYALHQARAGMSLNAISNPEDKVAVINTAGDPAPILAYYLDRHYQVYARLDLAAAASGWDYYCFLHKFRGLSDTDMAFINSHLTVLADTYVPTFTSKEQEVKRGEQSGGHVR